MSSKNSIKMGGLLRLDCAVQNYAWGKIGLSSKVAQLVKAGGGEVEQTKPYAEYWFGTHASGPAFLSEVDGNSKVLLSKYLSENPRSMGTLSSSTSGKKGQLPFLFKVLSVAKALSIQCHPNKEEARRLHIKDPEHYKDDNHKPEMAVALTDFEALCGFRPLTEIAAHFTLYPEFAAVVGNDGVNKLTSIVTAENDISKEDERRILELLVRAWMNCEASLLKAQLVILTGRLSRKYSDDIDITTSMIAEEALGRLVLRISKQYPGDVGIFAPLLLNFLQMKPGECVFLSAMVPHAYLSGDIMECMACSNNVIRAGLTPKFRDVEELCDCLVYESSKPMENQKKLISKLNNNTTVYTPPIDEFMISQITLPVGTLETEAFSTRESPSFIVVTRGEGRAIVNINDNNREEVLSAGFVFLLEAGASISVTAVDEMQLFRVHVKDEKSFM